ncbi:MAG: hypothetical protein IRZ16_02980, partial [Myxococcaceae bacterium]|nr:hypothetical protein [Myxococcaceae bacterium]
NEDGVLDANEVESTQVVCNGADGTNGTNGLTALAATSSEPAGANCPNGGTKLQFGLDDDADGVLDPAEVDSTSYACNGIDGLNVLATVTAEPAGANCASGGQKIETGADADADGVLDPAEIQNTAYVCNGTNGTNGLSGLVASTPEPAGANCPNGGTKLDFGLDDDGNGVLDPTEVDSTSYACNGIDGLSVVTSVTPEPAGANCANGGQKIEVGQDANRNGQLDAPEVQGTSYVCNGVDGTNGTDGKQTLIDITTEPAGANCAEGGQKLDYGVDDDGNGQLDADEIDGTRYLCSGLTGQNGHSTLVTVEPIPAGDTCAFGGQSILTGLDLNDDGVLDASEVTGNTSICNASPGEQGEKGDKGDKGDPGADGKSSLISVEAASAEACAAGGQTVKTGLDANGNGTLDAEEVSSSIDICQSTCTVKGGGDQNTVITCSDGTSSTIRAGGCSAAGGAGAWTWLLGLAGLPLIRRRRRA